MSIVAAFAAIAASICWSGAAILGHAPTRRLGAFEITKIQLIASSAILALVSSITGLWPSVHWEFWPAFLISSILVLLGNLALSACLRRAGPRRSQLLLSMNAPISTVLGILVLGEIIAPIRLVGALLTLSGIWLAIQFGREPDSEPASAPGQVAAMVLLGLTAATCQAVGLIVLKPALLAGTEPLAASALRTAGAAAATSLVALWPCKILRPLTKPTGPLVLSAIIPGLLGYVAAVSLLLFAVRHYETGIALLLGSLSPVIMLPMLWAITGRRPRPPAWLGAAAVVCGTGIILAT